ncbi:hypothetical protein BDA96_04G121200 [Sorghum bicolor]|uniref:Uncharacterized protein n=2 Tax=Sorghum bicolor TaxID=4558 RepID=A0A921UIS7_SORBI|nr:hypothetical protein BDA96_04G121200 [Sorghum bicolor]KXG29939.1 hypothetical protein SORBI_3004G112500 [Sorghum bicolor]
MATDELSAISSVQARARRKRNCVPPLRLLDLSPAPHPTPPRPCRPRGSGSMLGGCGSGRFPRDGASRQEEVRMRMRAVACRGQSRARTVSHTLIHRLEQQLP